MGRKGHGFMATHGDIFDAWKDKAVTRTGRIITELGYDGCNKNDPELGDAIPVVYDWGEPECWACGIGLRDYSFADDYGEDIQSIKKIWNNRKVTRNLERAHIVPKALGGSGEKTNLFLLCKDCHRDSPDTCYKEEFFKFVYERRKAGPIEKRARDKAIKNLMDEGIPGEYAYAAKIKLDETYGTHGSVVQESTMIAAIVGGARKVFEDVLALCRDVGVENTIVYMNDGKYYFWFS